MEDGTIRKSHWTETIGDDFVGYLAAVATLAETGLKLQVTELELQVKEYVGY